MPKNKKILSSKARRERAFMRLQAGLALLYIFLVGYGIVTDLEAGWLICYFLMLFFCIANTVWCCKTYYVTLAKEEEADLHKAEQSLQQEKSRCLTSEEAQATLSYSILAEAGIIRPATSLSKPSELERQLADLQRWVARETPKPKKKSYDDYDGYGRDDFYRRRADEKLMDLSELAQPVMDGLARYIEAEKQSQKALEPKDFAVDPQNHTPEEWEILRRYFQAAKPIEAKLGVENVSDTYHQYAHDALIDLAAHTAEELTQLHAVKQTMADNELLNAITSSGTRAALY